MKNFGINNHECLSLRDRFYTSAAKNNDLVYFTHTAQWRSSESRGGGSQHATGTLSLDMKGTHDQKARPSPPKDQTTSA